MPAVDLRRQSAMSKGLVLAAVLAGGLAGWLLLRPAPNPIASVRQKLQAQQSSAEALTLIASLRRELDAKSKPAAVRALRDYLERGLDAPTGAEFTVGPDGFLKSWPTLRVFLLDYLAQLDPAAAQDCARVILGRLDSPDEWAVSLRIIAQADSSASTRQWLADKMAQMLRHDPWVDRPATGFLEAFDVAVFLGGTNLVPDLSRLVRKPDNPAVAHAAFLALDRLVQAEPARMLDFLQADPTLLHGREKTRADFFARADAQDPRQREILERYLLNPELSAGELAQFAARFPSASFLVSDNLLTRVQTPDGAALARRDQAALETVNAWLADPRFAARQPQLRQIRQRLEAVTRQREGR